MTLLLFLTPHFVYQRRETRLVRSLASKTHYIQKIYCFSSVFAALGLEPDFLYPLENVTIAQGRDATFTCVVNNLGGYRVSGDSATARVCIKPTQYSYRIDEHFHWALYLRSIILELEINCFKKIVVYCWNKAFKIIFSRNVL